jgi:hypothetical protein
MGCRIAAIKVGIRPQPIRVIFQWDKLQRYRKIQTLQNADQASSTCKGEAGMAIIKALGFVAGALLLLGANMAEAACTYEGQSYPTGAVLCLGGKTYTCQSNDAWKVDRSSNCGG